MNQITLRTKAWFGDREESFPLPDGWDITVYPPRDEEALDAAGIQEALAKPVGAAPLKEIARGKKTAVIVVDDLSRPTPADTVAPFVIAELREAGVPADGIRFVIGGGAHRPLTGDEIARKLGRTVASGYRVFNHDAYSGTLTGMGNLGDGTPVFINEVVASSDVKVGLAGIYPHPSAGFGGGAKIVAPGVAGIATISYNHTLFPFRDRGTAERQSQAEDMRENAEKVARHIGLDMIVNAVVNSRREVAGLFVGDVVEAHEVGRRFARHVYETAIPQEATETTDIVIINAYPLDADPVQTLKSTWPTELFKRAYKVVIDDACDGIIYHGVGDGMDYGRYLRSRETAPESSAPREAVVTSTDQIIMLSEGFRPGDFYTHFEDGALFTRWDELAAEMRRVCPEGKVAVIPCSPIQLPTIS